MMKRIPEQPVSYGRGAGAVLLSGKIVLVEPLIGTASAPSTARRCRSRDDDRGAPGRRWSRGRHRHTTYRSGQHAGVGGRRALLGAQALRSVVDHGQRRPAAAR